ncbi:Mpp10 protein [Obba rivulosa]|uniref:U3 small nucleolar ribonucleoprotein protein MPP10 n=1 Tax=Obba rivulosa TaxID=1052685 RepID=A0A8E2DV26_9APHY|nr:Mpp10 protein [Obba rivulosa]
MATTEAVQLPPQLGAFSDILEKQPEAFATGSDAIRTAALEATKYIYDLALQREALSRQHVDGLLSSMSPAQAPQTRSQSSKSKRKRSPSPEQRNKNIPVLHDTPLTELFVDGMNEDQIWEQLELRAKTICSVLEFALESSPLDEEDDVEEVERQSKKMRQALAEEEMEDFPSGSEESNEDEDEDDEGEGEEDDSDEEDDAEEDADLGEGVQELRDPSEDEGSEQLNLDGPTFLSGGKRTLKLKRKAGGHPELDDGFFDLKAFNAEIEEAEARSVSRGKLGKGDSDDEDEDNEELDLFAPLDDSATAHLEGDSGDGSDEPFYQDFFDPPENVVPAKSKKSRSTVQDAASKGKVRFHEEVRVKKIKSKGKGLPLTAMYEEFGEDDGDEYGETLSDEESESGDMELDEDQEGVDSGSDVDDPFASDEEEDEDEGDEPRETIERLKDDLFADDDDEPQQDLSAHEQRMLALKEEISALEAQNVEKKDWVLMGEATSRSRPQNSLLEEDLEFERVMKSVPVITEEAVRGLEDRIKARILEGQFDDVVRKRPVDDKPFLPSRFFELEDTKSKKSLGEIYEDEYTAAQSGAVAGEDRDGKLKKEHEEIEKQWESICAKLDALSNAHFTPKPPKATISTVGNVAAATLESALPTTQATTTMLAPEEVFAPSPGELRARSELTPVEKRALRNKQKKANKKVRDTLEKSVDKFARANGAGSVKKQKDAALKSVVKSGKGVTVIGKANKDLSGKRKRTKA